MSKNSRINHEPAFMLAAQPWRESSLRVELYSRRYGRVMLLARSARKRQSELRGVLVPFVPVSASWYGEGELKTLHRAEWLGAWPQPAGRSLFSGLYLNELVCGLTAREDPNPELYDALFAAMKAVCTEPNHIAALRVFEWRLLHLSGLAPDILRDESGLPVEAGAAYLMRPESPPQRMPSENGVLLTNGFQTASEAGAAVMADGATLLDLAAGVFRSGDTLQQALRLNRMMLDFRLPEIRSRKILQQLQGWSREMAGKAGAQAV